MEITVNAKNGDWICINWLIRCLNLRSWNNTHDMLFSAESFLSSINTSDISNGLSIIIPSFMSITNMNRNNWIGVANYLICIINLEVDAKMI